MIDPILCPHCGQVIDLSDPRIRRLSPGAYHAYHRLRAALKTGQVVGVTRMAEIVCVRPPAMYRHLRQMINAGLAEAIPKRRGGVYRVYRLS